MVVPVLRVRVAGSGWEGGPSLNTFYFKTPLQDAAAATRVVSLVQEKWLLSLDTLFPPHVTHQVSGDVDVLNAENGQTIDTLSTTAPIAISGAGATASAPITVAALLRLSTGTFIAGRRVKGRCYFSPLATDRLQDDGTLTTVTGDIVRNFGNIMLGGLTALDEWVVWHRPVAGVGGSIAKITSTGCWDKLAVLRSRRD